MKNISRSALVISNLVPVFGVLFFDWSLFAIMLLYWSENLIIGFYCILKFSKVKVEDKEFKLKINKKWQEVGRFKYVLFFLLHFGLFTTIHGVFVYEFFYESLDSFFYLGITILLLFFSHGISYYSNYIGKKEYKKTSPQQIMAQPYKRVIIMHLTVLLTANFSVYLGTPKIAIIFLVFLKIIIDSISHSFEHKTNHPKKALASILPDK